MSFPGIFAYSFPENRDKALNYILKWSGVIIVALCLGGLPVKVGAFDIFTESDMNNGSLPYQGSSVMAFGYGSSYWELATARIRALDDLNAEKARIVSGLRPGLTVNWGQISETSTSDWSGHYVMLSQPGTVVAIHNPTAQAELTIMLTAVDNAIASTTDDELSGAGLGWIGNVTHLGPKCNEVHDILSAEILSILESLGYLSEYYQFVTLFEEGMLPGDLAAHVYFGIIDIRTGEIVYIFDPWRTGDGDPIDPDENPNGDPEMIVPW